MYLAHYDTETGTIKGFYLPDLHQDIPMPTLEITAEQHKNYFDKGQYHKAINNKFVYVEPEPQSPRMIVPALNQDIADLWEAILAIAAAQKGGK